MRRALAVAFLVGLAVLIGGGTLTLLDHNGMLPSGDAGVAATTLAVLGGFVSVAAGTAFLRADRRRGPLPAKGAPRRPIPALDDPAFGTLVRVIVTVIALTAAGAAILGVWFLLWLVAV